MVQSINPNDVTIVQDMEKAISIMYEVGNWLLDNGKDPHKYFFPKNMNAKFLLEHISPDEFYVVLINGEPASSMIIQNDERNQSWESVDKGNPKKALYLHWLAVSRNFAGMGLSQIMINFAIKEAKERGFERIRLDTDANEPKLTNLYKNLGFEMIHIEKEESIDTAFFEMNI